MTTAEVTSQRLRTAASARPGCEPAAGRGAGACGRSGRTAMAEDGRASGSDRRHHRRKRRSTEDREPERKKKRLHQEVKKIKHVETFYEKPPPGMIKEHDDKPEDCIPDLPGNEEARDFLAHAPTKGLWMPLGKEVKVMQCWRCKNFGHRTGDRECPYFISGNQKLEQFRVAHEDPMYDVIRANKRHEKESRFFLKGKKYNGYRKNLHCCPKCQRCAGSKCKDTAAETDVRRYYFRQSELQFLRFQ
ncbi:retinitis pigmentosa 9 protein isoform X2 [Mobula hypostoma]|uniref:retinitis pigmentosa 9 protein isoform X2 n=1 Tax=Mobula hypostoma TaxID=723540 RepID=UPI002FC32741